MTIDDINAQIICIKKGEDKTLNLEENQKLNEWYNYGGQVLLTVLSSTFNSFVFFFFSSQRVQFDTLITHSLGPFMISLYFVWFYHINEHCQFFLHYYLICVLLIIRYYDLSFLLIFWVPICVDIHLYLNQPLSTKSPNVVDIFSS